MSILKAKQNDSGFRKFDLNLLRILDALYKEGSATRAAARLGVSQPTVSSGLARLRADLGDELFIKHAGGLYPTERAAAIEGAVATILSMVQEDVLSPNSFDPTSSTRVFRVLTGQIGQMIYLSRILAALRARAPHVRIKIVSHDAHRNEDLLASNEADVALGYFPAMQRPTYFQQRLYESRLVCVTRKGNPHADTKLSLAQFVELEHVIVGKDDEYYSVYSSVLQKMGMNLTVALELPNISGVPQVLEETNFVAVVPESLAQMYCRTAQLSVYPVPVSIPTVQIRQYWHRRLQEDPANQWFRKLIVELLQEKR